MGKKNSKCVLVTGGSGFIGSHTVIELLNIGEQVIIADNFSNSNKSIVKTIGQITGIDPKLYEINIADKDLLHKIFEENRIDAIIHFAGYKAVGESVTLPVKYYRNNIETTLSLLEVMGKFDVKKIIFSSSATVYGMSTKSPFNEETQTNNCTNPYGWTKFMNERILLDASAADPEISVVILRYFNPVGAHESGLIGENPSGTPNNLMPYITQVAAGILEKLLVFGDDYMTTDGTGVRDYIHVVDLAKGHVAALSYLRKHTGTEIFNLGTGCGYSVLDMVHTFQRVNNITIPYAITTRRSGDIACSYADISKAEKVLGWKPEKSIEDMCRDAWRWEINRLK